MPSSALRFSLAALALATISLAQGDFEGPTTFKASAVLPPALLKGPHFTVADTVKTEGYFHEFQIASDYGALTAEGRSLLERRVREVESLARLDEVSKSGVFLQAAGNSVLNVGKGVASVITKPEETVKGMGTGMKRFGTNLGRKAKRGAESAEDVVKSDDTKKDPQAADKSTTDKAADAGTGATKSVLGVNKAMRRWAQKVAADPYTTNPVLRKALEDVAEIDAAGGIAAKIVVPIPMVVGTTASVGGLVWGKDPEELLKINEQRLSEMGTDPKVAKEFFKNKALTPTYQTRLIAALHAVKVKGCADYVDTASDSETERDAMFYVESVEMLQRLHAKTPVVALLPDSKALVAKGKDGQAIVLLAVDWAPWSAAFQKGALEIQKRAKEELGATRVELLLTGRASVRAKQELKALGYAVTENVPHTVPTAPAPAK
jgi:hypothetical protein